MYFPQVVPNDEKCGRYNLQDAKTYKSLPSLQACLSSFHMGLENCTDKTHATKPAEKLRFQSEVRHLTLNSHDHAVMRVPARTRISPCVAILAHKKRSSNKEIDQCASAEIEAFGACILPWYAVFCRLRLGKWMNRRRR